MNAQDLLTTLIQCGVRLEVKGDTICVDAPRGVITPALHAAMAEQKANLISLLTSVATMRDGEVSCKRISQGNETAEPSLPRSASADLDSCPGWMKEVARGLEARLPGVEMIFTPLDISVEDGEDSGEADMSREDQLVHVHMEELPALKECHGHRPVGDD